MSARLSGQKEFKAAAMVIRKAEASDLAQVVELYAELHPGDTFLVDDAAMRGSWSKMLSSPHLTLLLAEIDGRAVSTCALTIVPNLTHGARPYGVIENVVTRVDFRRKGIGRAVLGFALQLAWDGGCYKVMLMTGTRRESTLRFYEKAGFMAGEKTAFIARPESRATRIECQP